MASALPAELSGVEKAALEEFRVAVQDILNKPEEDDPYYLRWLRARKFNVQKAIDMFRNHIDHRARFGADTILEDWTPPEVLTLCFPGGFFGEDKGGHPVWYDCMGNLDFRGLHRSAEKEDILKYKCFHAMQCDKLLEKLSAEKQCKIETVTAVIDFENLSLQKHYYWPGLELLKEVMSQVEANCPERVEYVLIVRAPRVFPMCYNLVKHIFNEATRKKISIFGANWKEELQEYISPDQLPKAYGGNRCEPDEWCTNYINPGCDVPTEYYLTNKTHTSPEEMETIIVGRGVCHRITYDVTEVGSELEWEFMTTDYDIGFGLSVLVEGQKKECLLPVSRCNSHIIPQVGRHCCTVAGKYVLKFDNSFSWTRTKELFYSIKLSVAT